MLKISKVGTANRSVTFKLEGRVVGPWVEELRQACDPVLAERRKLKLDLTDVSFADAAGVGLLSGFKSCGVLLQNCSAFIQEQLKAH